MADEKGRLLHLLLPTNGQSKAASMLPADTVAMLAGAMTDGSQTVDAVCDLLEAIDSDIVEEYQAELAEATAEFGFNPQHDFLGNMVDEWALGIGVDEERGGPQLVLLIKLADPDLFIRHLRNLETAYQLPIETVVHRDVEVFCATGTEAHRTNLLGVDKPKIAEFISGPEDGSPRLAMATLDGYLVVSPSPAAVVKVIDAQG